MTPRDDNAIDTRRAYFADIKGIPVLEWEEQRTLAERFLAGDAAAGDRLVTSNLRLVAKIAGEFRRYRLSFLDLVQEGNVGLMHATRKFDPSFGTKFSTYASFWIRAYMLRHVLQSWSLVKIATTQDQRKVFFRLPAAQRALANQTGDGNDPVAIAAAVGVKPSVVETMLSRLSSGDASLDAPYTDGDGRVKTPLDMLADERPSAEDRLDEARERAAATSVARDALAILDHRERFIVESRAMSDEPLTLAEIGRQLGCSRERVRQLQTRAHDKMRRHVASRRPS